MRWEARHLIGVSLYRRMTGSGLNIQEAKKGQAEIRPGLLGESAQVKLPDAGAIFRFSP